MPVVFARRAGLLCALAVAWTMPSASAQPALVPHAAAPAGVDPRRGPRLLYHRGPLRCLSEASFRDEVAILLDGTDHFSTSSPDTIAVRFEMVPDGFRATLTYTDAQGRASAPVIRHYWNCEGLARWIASAATDYVPPPPKPPAPPLPDVPACEVRPACGSPRLHPWPARVPLPSVPPGLETYEVVAPPLSLLDRLKQMDVTIALSGLALLGIGVTENVNGGFNLGADVRGQILSLGIEFRGMPPSRVYARERIDPTAIYSVSHGDVSEWTGLLVPCARYKWFVGCAVAQGGVLLWQGATQAAAPVLNFGPRIGVEIPIGDRFGICGFGEALFRAVRPHVDLIFSDVPDLPPANVRWSSSPAVGIFSVGVIVKLG